MDNVWIIIITSLISGILATILTIIVQRISEVKRSKRDIFEILMSHRYMIPDKINVEALNKIDVVFYKDESVRKSWGEFLAAADAAKETPNRTTDVNDKYLRLLEEIAKVIGYNNINWENIKKYYFPQGLSTKIMEEETLRKVQIQQALQESKQDRKNPSVSAQEVGFQFVMKALDSPNGMETLQKIIELGSKGDKK